MADAPPAGKNPPTKTVDATPQGSVAPLLRATHPWFPWAAPFILYIALLAAAPYLPVDSLWNHVARLVLCGGVILVFSRWLFSLRMVNPVGSILLGIAVFLIWIAPDTLWPGYRTHWLFSNGLLGIYNPQANGEMADAPWFFFILRLAVSVLLVPVVEELFWRGFIMRIVIRNDFETVPLGTWNRNAFLITAVLFALEHGFYWDVGLAAGILYNAWIVKTKSLGDVIWAHAITNGLLAAWVMTQGAWQFWP